MANYRKGFNTYKFGMSKTSPINIHLLSEKKVTYFLIRCWFDDDDSNTNSQFCIKFESNKFVVWNSIISISKCSLIIFYQSHNIYFAVEVLEQVYNVCFPFKWLQHNQWLGEKCIWLKQSITAKTLKQHEYAFFSLSLCICYPLFDFKRVRSTRSSAIELRTHDPEVMSSSPVCTRVLCPWARLFTLNILLSTQVYKWVPA